MAAPALSGDLVIKTRVFDGILTGIASAAIGGAIWWVVASLGDFDQWHYASVIVGILVGFGVVLGTRRGGLVSGIYALLFSSAAVLVAVYFISRSLDVKALTDAGRSVDVPLWQGFGHGKDVIQGWIDYDKAKAAGWLLGPVFSLIIAAWPGRRPAVG